MPSFGALNSLGYALAFGAMAIFGKLAYDEGATVGTLLAVRFLLAAALFWVLVAGSGAARRLRTVPWRDVALGLALGGVAYSAQARAYFAALERLDASLLSLLLYTFPAMVTVAAIVLGRERANRRTAGALGLSSSGLFLVLAGAGAGALDPLGALLGVTAAIVYSTYVLTSAGIADRLGPLVVSALVCTGAAATLTLAAAGGGDLRLGDVSPAGFGWLAGLAVVSTVGAVSLFFAGLRRVGPTTASILSTAEPLTTVLLAFVAFGESLAPVQLAGGALVLGAVLALSAGASVVVPDHADVEGEHDRAEDGDDGEAGEDLAPVEVLEDERAERLHQVGDRVERGRHLHRPGEQVARHEVRRQEQQREEDEAGGVGGRRAARLERDELHEADEHDGPQRGQRDQQDEADRPARDRDAEDHPEHDERRRDHHALRQLRDQTAQHDRRARDGRRAQFVEVAALDVLDEE
jgi:drug/metabolite transporter (DMT)-like permease